MTNGIRTMLLAVVMILSTAAAAQTTIAGGEYWIDGAIEARQALSPGATIDISALMPGLHTLTMRVKDSNSLWSNQVARIFYIMPDGRTDATSVTACEYWMDGIKKTEYTTLGAQSIDISSLTPGLHKLMVRVKDDLGIWSNQMSRIFYVTPGGRTNATNIVKREFWIDDQIAQRQVIEGTPAVIDISSLPSGMHMLTLRVQDDKGVWSNQMARLFFVAPLPDATEYALTKYMYWLDQDTEHAVIGDIAESDGQLVIDVEALVYDDSEHTLTLCVCDTRGVWSNLATETFKGNPAPDLTKDDEGYYLLASAADWKAFAALIETEPTANARMTEDIDLGDDQTMIGTEEHPYQGTFDGQGHTLNVNYDVNITRAAPFRFITNATIRNLHVTGSLTTTAQTGGGIVSWTEGTCLIERCYSSVVITANKVSATADTYGGIIGCNYKGNLTLQDCIFDGSITTTEKDGCGGLVGFTEVGGTATATNCLLTATFDLNNNNTNVTLLRHAGYGTVENISNCYYLNGLYVKQGTQVTDEQLANGTIATALQADRDETVWVQDPLTNQPMLKIFANKNLILGDANDSGEVEIGDITSVLTLMANPDATGYNNKAADANQSGAIEIGDITTILTIMAGGE